MKDVRADAKAIFLEALDCQGTDTLQRFLDDACGADAALRLRVEELLRAHGDAGAFLGGAVPQGATRDESIAERPGTVIGPYKLMEQIGEGGMGLVFVAEQQHPVRRKVAIKVIKPGMDTREVIARFEAERQALALMDHPNIARVFDAGETESGQPYFVMELVRGVGITEFCDVNRLTLRERLELFVHVCQAVQHAHQKGIIHRDLKAANILVTLHDGTPVVKVIDFGVAKAIGQQLTHKTIYTRFAQMIGTPMYMSPEQAEMSGLDIDTRSDIYALGVLLGGYEAYAGARILHADRPNQPISFDVGADISYIAISPLGQWVVTVTQSGLGKVWDASDGSLVKTLGKQGAYHPRFSPDGVWLSTAADGGQVFAVSGWEPGPRFGSWGPFAPDSQVIAVQPTIGAIRLVDRETGREFAKLEDPEFDATAALFFTSEGDKLIGLGNKKFKAIRVWDLRLIRQRLKPLDLDWDRPEFAPADATKPKAPAPTIIEILAGDTAKPALTPEQIAREVIALSPKYARAHFNLGVILSRQKKFAEASASYRQAAQLDPKNVVARSNLATALWSCGKVDEAIAAYREALVLEPKRASTRSHLSFVLNHTAWRLANHADPKARNPARAVELAKEAIELMPKATYWNTLGAAHYRANDWKAAVTALHKSMELRNGGDSFEWFFLAMAHWQLGDKDQARKWYNQAALWMDKHQPKNEELRRFRAEAEELLKKVSGDGSQQL